jgi:hypothetical protein
MVRQTLFRIITIGVGTTPMGYCSVGEKLGLSLNKQGKVETYAQG